MPTRTMTSGARLGSCAVAGSRSERESDVSERGSNVGRLKATGFWARKYSSGVSKRRPAFSANYRHTSSKSVTSYDVTKQYSRLNCRLCAAIRATLQYSRI